MLVVGCRIGGVRGNGNVVEEARDVTGFSHVDVSGVFSVKIEAGKDNKVVVRAESNLMKYIVTTVKGDKLIISTRKNINPKKDLKIYIATNDIKSINASGATDIKIYNIDTEKFYADLSGASDLKLEGKVNKLMIDASGASEIHAKNLIANSVKIDASGASDVSVHANQSLIVDASGASNIDYYGTPTKVSHDISGAGSLNKKGN